MVRGNVRAISEVYVLNVTCYDVDTTVGYCAECTPHVFTYMTNIFLIFMCVCVVFIDVDLSPHGHVISLCDVALTLCYFYC